MLKHAAIISAELLLAIALQSWGQSLPLGADTAAAPAAVLPIFSTLRYDCADTLRAVQHLFMRRSKAIKTWLEGGAALLATGAVKKTIVASRGKDERQNHKSRSKDVEETGSGDLLIGGLMAGYGAFRYTRFGPKQYQRVVMAYQEGQPLPPYLSRKLKTKYFRLLPLGSRQERIQAIR